VRGIVVRFLTGVRGLVDLQSAQTDSGNTSNPPFQWIPFVKWQKHETDRSTISDTEVKYEWSCQSNPRPHLLSLYEQSCNVII